MGQSYRDLLVWQESYKLTREVYELTQKLPRYENYGLVSQMRRAAVSVSSNIAEGQQRESRKVFKQFLLIARGSAAELSTQLQLCTDIYQINTTATITHVERVQKMLYALIQSIH